MSKREKLFSEIEQKLSSKLLKKEVSLSEITLEVAPKNLIEVCDILKNGKEFCFDTLIDVCGVDYLHYGLAEWETEEASSNGFCRGVNSIKDNEVEKRFAVVYHFLSVIHNHRLRIKVFLDGDPPIIPSITGIWKSADWFEREVFDMYGIFFENHPDLRRILTDYGFVGHPFRKDFPLSGEVEVKYDEEQSRVVYQPVTIEPRVLTPKVIRKDSRYA